MKIAVIGTGYVGLVTGACLANTGNTVTCVDVDAEKIAKLREGELPIYEEGLAPIVQRNSADGRLLFTTDAGDAIRGAEVIFIAVGTPQDKDGSADLRYVLEVAETIGENMNDYKVVICKSTVPVGTCDRVYETIAARTDVAFDVVSNPEFLKEGSAVQDFQSPDRVIIGANSARAAEIVGDLYLPFQRRSDRIVYMDVRSAEMTKYASNAMLATKISFMNEIANLCEAVGADVERVRRGMSMDERIGPHFIYAGVGYGGSCFPKDVRALSRLGDEHEARTQILDAVDEVNVHQRLHLVRSAKAHFGSFEGLRFAVWGLSFKPRTDDVREAPALASIAAFLDGGAEIVATDPIAIDNARAALGEVASRVRFVKDEYTAVNDADALFVFTEWNQYRNPDFRRIAQLMKAPVVFDGRNLYRPERLRELGFEYYGVGRR